MQHVLDALHHLGEPERLPGKDATVHYRYARSFNDAFPAVPIHPERVLVISGTREELVTSGAASGC